MSRFLVFFLAGLAGALLADRKGRNRLLWSVLCFFFPPLLFLLLLLPLKLSGGRTKQCPYCGRVLPVKEAVCRYCRKELPIEMVKCQACGSFVPDKDYCIQCHRELKQQ